MSLKLILHMIWDGLINGFDMGHSEPLNFSAIWATDHNKRLPIFVGRMP